MQIENIDGIIDKVKMSLFQKSHLMESLLFFERVKFNILI